MKPKNVYKDEKALAEKNKSNYLKRMRSNKYWKRGWKAASKGKNENDNPYQLTPEIMELLRKRTFWLMGYEENPAPTKRRLKEQAKLGKKRRKHKHK